MGTFTLICSNNAYTCFTVLAVCEKKKTQGMWLNVTFLVLPHTKNASRILLNTANPKQISEKGSIGLHGRTFSSPYFYFFNAEEKQISVKAAKHMSCTIISKHTDETVSKFSFQLIGRPQCPKMAKCISRVKPSSSEPNVSTTSWVLHHHPSFTRSQLSSGSCRQCSVI